MKLKMDDDGRVVVADGRPVYVHDDGKESPFDAFATVQTLNRTLDESKKYKERAQTAEAALKGFEGIENPDDARKALQTIRNLDQGQLVTAGKVEEIREAARKAAEEQVQAAAKSSAEKIKSLQGERDKLLNDLYSEKVGGSFSRSKFVTEKVATPPDMLQAMFGPRFKVEEGRTVGYDNSGNKIYSRAKPGEIADFDEALEMMVDAYPYRDQILKGSGSTGSGAKPSNGGGSGKRTVRRAEYDSMSPLDQRSVALDVSKGSAQIID